MVLLVVTCEALGQGNITGRVTARGGAADEPLVGATVSVEGTIRGTTTGAGGEYRIGGLPGGNYTIVVSMVGYLRERKSGIGVVSGSETVVNVTLIQAPVPLEQIVVTASKRQQSLEDVPLSVSVLDAREFQRLAPITIDDALRHVPGVNMTGTQVNIRGSSGYSRGAGSRVLLLVDGIPFLTGDTGELIFEAIPVAQVDRIEVVKGASSALYGSNALGGVINIITKSIPETPETSIRTYGGFYGRPSYEQWRWSDRTRFLNGQSVSHARKVGDFGLSLFLSRQMDDGYRKNDYHRRYNLLARINDDFTPLTSLTMSFGLLHETGGQFLYWRNIDSALIPAAKQEQDNTTATRYYLSGLYRSVVTPQFLITAKGQWFHNHWGFETLYDNPESYSDGFRGEVLATCIPSSDHTITVGTEGNVDMIGGEIFSTHTIGGLAFYGQDEISLPYDLALTLGLRYDFESVGLTSAQGQLSPKVAVSYKPGDGTTLRASFGRGFRVPSVAEAFLLAGSSSLAAVPNNGLRPERSISFEAGLTQVLGAVGTIDIAAFRSDYSDLIEPGLVVSDGNLLIQWRNVTEARVQGVEASVKSSFFDGLVLLNVGYTYVYPEDLTQHDLLRYRPRHVLYGNLSGRIDQFIAGVDFRYLSRVDRIDDELVNVGIIPDGDERNQIVVTDLRLGADITVWGIGLEVNLNINNILQYNYVELIGNIMPPRTYVLSLEAKL